MKKIHLRVLLAVGAAILIWLTALDAKTKKGDQLFKQGETAENKGDWDTALSFYQKAVDESSNDAGYMIAMRRARFQAGEKHVGEGRKLRGDGKIAEALQEFNKALVADPSSGIALQEIKRTQQMLERNNKAGAKADETNLTPVEQARREEDQRVASIEAPPELKPVIRKIPSLTMNNQSPRVLYETVAGLAGFHVIMDPTYQPARPGFNVDLGPSDVMDALDTLALITHTFWKPISSDSIFVTEENTTKRRDYEDSVVKTFYLTNTTSVQEFQEIANAVRTATTIRAAFTYNAQKALVLRGTQDQIKLAEKLIHDLDKPKSEVVIEVIIMTANTTHTRDLAATLVNASGAPGLNIPAVFAPRSSIAVGGTSTPTPTNGGTTPATGSGTTTAIGLNNLGHIASADFATTLPGALLEAIMSDNRTRVLDRPQLRTSDGMKATLNIGDRIPYATGSFQPGVGTVGVSPLVSTQFQFIDTGTTITMTPAVHSATEVTLTLEINVSSESGQVDLGGLTQPIISQNKSTSDIRLRDGEPTILNGLSSVTDIKNISGIPGLANLPILGPLFGTHHDEKNHSELLIALIPHIIRTPDYTPENLRGINTGSELVVKVAYAPPKDEPASPAPAATAPGATPPSAGVAPGTPGPGPAQPGANTPGPAPAPAPAAPVHVSFNQPSVQAARNNTFTLTVQVDSVADLMSMSPLRIKYDPAQLELTNVAPGSLFSKDGAQVSLMQDVRNDAGQASLIVTRQATTGVSGGGIVATLSFVAHGMGSGTIAITEAGLKNSQAQTLQTLLGSVAVTVQ